MRKRFFGHGVSEDPPTRSVRFLQHDAPFKRGEVAVFARATADRLVTSGVAEYVITDLPVVRPDFDEEIEPDAS